MDGPGDGPGGGAGCEEADEERQHEALLRRLRGAVAAPRRRLAAVRGGAKHPAASISLQLQRVPVGLKVAIEAAIDAAIATHTASQRQQQQQQEEEQQQEVWSGNVFYTGAHWQAKQQVGEEEERTHAQPSR